MSTTPEVSDSNADFGAELDALRALFEDSEYQGADLTELHSKLEELKGSARDELPPELQPIRAIIEDLDADEESGSREEITKILQSYLLQYPLEERTQRAEAWLSLLDIDASIAQEIAPVSREQIEETIRQWIDDYFQEFPLMTQVIEEADLDLEKTKEEIFQQFMSIIPDGEVYPASLPDANTGTNKDGRSIQDLLWDIDADLNSRIKESRGDLGWLSFAQKHNIPNPGVMVLGLSNSEANKLSSRITGLIGGGRNPETGMTRAWEKMGEMVEQYQVLRAQVGLRNAPQVERSEDREALLETAESDISEAETALVQAQERVEQATTDGIEEVIASEPEAEPDEFEKLFEGLPDWLKNIFNVIVQFLSGKELLGEESDEEEENPEEEPPEAISEDEKLARVTACLAEVERVEIKHGLQSIDDKEGLKMLLMQMPEEVFTKFEEILRSDTGKALLGMGLAYEDFQVLMDFHLMYPGALEVVVAGVDEKLKLVVPEGSYQPENFDPGPFSPVSQRNALIQQVNAFRAFQENNPSVVD